MGNYLAVKYSPHWIFDYTLFKTTQKITYGSLLAQVEREIFRANKNLPVKNYLDKYSDPYLPPSWIAVEYISFGIWSRLYAILRHVEDKKAISEKFGIEVHEVIESWLHTLSILRNITSHRGRILGRSLMVQPKNYQRAKLDFPQGGKSFYPLAVVISWFSHHIKRSPRWQNDLIALFEKYPTIAPNELGFPNDWPTHRGWCGALDGRENVCRRQ